MQANTRASTQYFCNNVCKPSIPHSNIFLREKAEQALGKQTKASYKIHDLKLGYCGTHYTILKSGRRELPNSHELRYQCPATHTVVGGSRQHFKKRLQGRRKCTKIETGADMHLRVLSTSSISILFKVIQRCH